MYRLRDFIHTFLEAENDKTTSAELYCHETDPEFAYISNKMQESIATYCYTLVRQGTVTMICNDQHISVGPGDILIYSPGFQVTITTCSEDYRGICLIADEDMTLEMPIVHDIIRTAYLPLAEWGKPVMHVPDTHIDRIWNRMRELIEYQHLPHRFRKETLRSLYTLFLLDLIDLEEFYVETPKYGERTTEIFISFMRLLPKHFAGHHDIGFYASELCVTTTHLSRIVRQITGRTVMYYINKMLVMEAIWLLKDTNLSILSIAERMHFANKSSFSKFFLRMKGITPKQYRMSC